MQIIPAIDLLDGKCVRLTQGDRKRCTTYSANPLEVIRKFKEEGASLVHVVDLNGAFDGTMLNFPTIRKLTKEMKIEVGGGVRSKERIDRLRGIGVSRIIVGIKLKELKKYGIIAGLDFKDGKIAVNGWVTTKEEQIAGLLEGVKEAVVTDISRDGMLGGPNLELMKTIQSYGVRVIASGGIRSLLDIVKLKETGVSGTIIGKALYEGKLSLKEAIRYAD